MNGSIEIIEVRENNLKGFDISLPYGKLIVITGVSGAGKSSLAFSTLYAEGYRRYVETFSPYARQFLEKFQRPKVKDIKGMLPAIGIQGTNSVRTTRSTVGTVSEILDFLKIFWARQSSIICKGCGREVKRNSPLSIWKKILNDFEGMDLIIAFPIILPSLSEWEFAKDFILKNGFLKIFIDGRIKRIEEISKINEKEIIIIQDRIRVCKENFQRMVDSIEGALKWGKGNIAVISEKGRMELFSEKIFCPYCKIEYKEANPLFFSYNSPVGACEECRGFGKVISIDMDKVIPDKNLSLIDGAIKPWQTETFYECQQDLIEYCKRKKIPIDIPFSSIPDFQKKRIVEGDEDFYGIMGFFDYLEKKSYKMHIRILSSKYRSYTPCPRCKGTRLKQECLNYRLGGITFPEFYNLPLYEARNFISNLEKDLTLNKATQRLINEISKRINYLCEIGLSYLTLDRESKTLSGGEMERLSLARALSSPLINTLYVFDEPSLGLHPEDVSRLIRILKKLCENNNTVVVVEHDPDIIKSADIVVDLGPRGGEGGGRCIYAGDLKGFLKCEKSITAEYLSKKDGIEIRSERGKNDNFIEIKEAFLHNLKNINVSLPLNSLTVITGVSGSGKSTLLIDVLYHSLKENKNIGCSKIEGKEFFDEFILIDQTPIGTTSRSNPATYTKVFDLIRKEFANTTGARLMEFNAGDFSFNSGLQRCEVCEGQGWEKIEMQFLPDVFLQCPKCKGKRYKNDILEVKIDRKNISDILELTIEEANDFFRNNQKIKSALKPLIDIGLGYLKLGQGANTLSSGEAQRLKLATYFQKVEKNKKILFLMDEPSCGLHIQEISRFLRVIKDAINRGHGVFIIEHNLQIIAEADFVLDLGPQGGDRGGDIVFSGWMNDFLNWKNSRTAKFLREYLCVKKEEGIEISRTGFQTLSEGSEKGIGAEAVDGAKIKIFGAREHNLKGIDIEIPQRKIVTITGVSGSGKSTLAFDILYAEGQRRFIETLSVYSRQFIKQLPQPDIEGIENIPPSIAIEQRTTKGGGFSTLATLTGIYYYLRLLFARAGVQFCTNCNIEVGAFKIDEIIETIEKKYKGKNIKILSQLIYGRKGHYKNLFADLIKRGFKEALIDGEIKKLKEGMELQRYVLHNIDVVVGDLMIDEDKNKLKEFIEKAESVGKGVIKILKSSTEVDLYNTERICPGCGVGYEVLDPRDFTYQSPVGRCERCKGSGYENYEEGFDEEENLEFQTCTLCKGSRLNKKVLNVLFEGLSIADVCGMTAERAFFWFNEIYKKHKRDKLKEGIISEIIKKLKFLNELGLSYLTLSRRGNTLSTGEARRVNLASHLGGNLSGIVYVLDEPTIGLHPRDGKLLIDKLKNLRDEGNSVVVVEHDENVIRNSDIIIDLGPGSGKYGGNVVCISTPSQIVKNKNSITGKLLLKKPETFKSRKRKIDEKTLSIRIKGARANNLKNIDLEIPLQRLVSITGVSGAGKSSLIFDVLYKGLKNEISRIGYKTKDYDKIEGYENIKNVYIVDQSPIGRTPRSIPATYIGFFDYIRDFYSNLKESRIRGYTKSRFSFNLKGGRCEKCEGQGRVKVEMALLPDVYIPCEICCGKRYNKQTLEVEYNGKNISDVLEMDVESACEFFRNIPHILYPLEIMRSIGLGYLALGQPSPSLSGGEAQRIKLCEELSKRGGLKNLYILDEPTTGLHRADVDKLLFALQKLVDRGDSVIVIEHNLDVISASDYIIDLGPDGGDGGGEIVCMGPPYVVAKNKNSWTGKFLKNIKK